MRKEYPGRNSYLYRRDSIYNLNQEEVWLNCDCGAKSKQLNEEDVFCKVCNRSLENYEIVDVARDALHFYNRMTTSFIDDDIFTISFFVTSVGRLPDYVPLVFREGSLSMKVRFDRSKRTALIYTTNFKNAKPYIKEQFLRYGKFKNFTQPPWSYYSTTDIKLPPELISDFCEFLGIQKPKDPHTSLLDLAWMNRLQTTWKEAVSQRYMLKYTVESYNSAIMDISRELLDFKSRTPLDVLVKQMPLLNDFNYGMPYEEQDAMIPKILSELSSVDAREDYPVFARRLANMQNRCKGYLALKKNRGRIKRYLKSGRKIKNYDRLILEGLFCKDVNLIQDEGFSDKLIQAYLENPWATKGHKTMRKLFSNDAILIEAIRSISEFKSWKRDIEHHDGYPFEQVYASRSDILKTFSKKARTKGVDSLTKRNVCEIEKKILKMLTDKKDEMTFEEALTTLRNTVNYSADMISQNKLRPNFVLPGDIKKAKVKMAKEWIGTWNHEIKDIKTHPSETLIYGKDVYEIIHYTDWIQWEIQKQELTAKGPDVTSKGSYFEVRKNNKTIFLVETYIGKSAANRGSEIMQNPIPVLGYKNSRKDALALVNYAKRHRIDIRYSNLRVFKEIKTAPIKVKKIA